MIGLVLKTVMYSDVFERGPEGYAMSHGWQVGQS